jgi:hypothetical protein
MMSNTKKQIENCESCNRPFLAGTLTTDGLCSDCEEYWFDNAINQAQQAMNWRNQPKLETYK